MKLRIVVAVIILALGTLACADTFTAKIAAYGESHSIKCYSGGVVIYEGTSTGKVTSPVDSDGYQFKSMETGRLTEVSGECIIETFD
ncbi:hypothetical protein LCGC14_0461450 [marine sediment metagenome]|uniref:Uncharacterized protein n=1 Tax=marine sediment metagenome TaxID=412755 RepID=A0A0F9SXQ3_9ZZZZ